MYPIIEVPPDASDMPEQLGTKRKFWFRNDHGAAFLFKEGRPNTGENWAEKVCCEIAALIGLPHAQYDLGVWQGRKGVVSPKFLPDNSRLILGNEVLGKMVKDYAPTSRYRAREHRLSLVLAIVTRPWIGLPLGYAATEEITKGYQVFIGYLLLDALVGNQDRHHENWGLILSPGRKVTLAPTFDHASSLGRNELDDERLRRLNTKDTGGDMNTYCSRATSAFFAAPTAQADKPKPLGTVTAFREAAHADSKAGKYWLDRLRNTNHEDYATIFANVPSTEITEPAAQFALKMIKINWSRLLNLQSEL